MHVEEKVSNDWMRAIIVRYTRGRVTRMNVRIIEE